MSVSTTVKKVGAFLSRDSLHPPGWQNYKRYSMKKHSIRIPKTLFFHTVWWDPASDDSSDRKSLHDAVKTCGFSHFSLIVSEATRSGCLLRIRICYSSVVIVSFGMFLWWTMQTLNGQGITAVLPQAKQRQEVLFYCSNYSCWSQQEAVHFLKVESEGARPKCLGLSHVLTYFPQRFARINQHPGMISFFTTEDEVNIKLELYLSNRGFVLTTASQRWWHSVQQHFLSCDIAFIQQFYKLCFGLVGSNEKKQIISDYLSVHLNIYLPPLTQTVVRLDRTNCY